MTSEEIQTLAKAAAGAARNGGSLVFMNAEVRSVQPVERVAPDRNLAFLVNGSSLRLDRYQLSDFRLTLKLNQELVNKL